MQEMSLKKTRVPRRTFFFSLLFVLVILWVCFSVLSNENSRSMEHFILCLFIFFAKNCFELLFFWFDDHLTIWFAWIICIILLVISFCEIKGFWFSKLCDDGLRIIMRYLLYNAFCNCLLWWRLGPNDWTVLRSLVVSLLIHTRGIMNCKKVLEKCLIWYSLRIKKYSDCFDIATDSCTNTFVCRKWSFSSCISWLDVDHSWDDTERSFDTPKTSSSDNHCLIVRDAIANVVSDIFFLDKDHTDTIDTMADVFCCALLTMKNMSKMSITLTAYDFCPHSIIIWYHEHCSGNCVIKCWPSTMTIKFVWRKI